FSLTCAVNAKMINLYPNRLAMLHQLNVFRDKVATGYTRTLYPAARMARVVWSKELEYFAKLYITKCTPIPRPCMSSPMFTNIGSIYDGVTYSGKRSIIGLVEGIMKSWFEDAHFVTREMSLSLTGRFERATVRQVVLLMTDRNTHMGCSAMTYANKYSKNLRIACTFATDNMVYQPIYKIASSPGNQCKKRDKVYKHLCSVGEKYNNSHRYSDGEL
ncbi:hypothetical protein KR222_001958, partial [Zaprionus bogoriensis]